MSARVPDAALEQHVVALGKTGAGKSYALRGLVERLLHAGKRVCIVDPKGDWWGLKSSASGKEAGYPVVIFGGERADVPLNQHVGGQVAELIATGNRPAIIDFGGWMVGERTRFWIDFASGLFKHNRAPLWLVIDEVHNFAPQGKVLDPDAGKCLHWTNRLASEGRGKGLRILMASQRPQKVHKDALTCAETLIALKVVHPRDREAVKEWIDGCGDPETGKTILNTLAGLPRGEGYVWSPEIGFLERVRFPAIQSYDSFAAPTEDHKALPKGWAEVDLDDVKARLASVVSEAKANDPRELKREIAELKRELKTVREAQSSAPALSSADLEHIDNADRLLRAAVAAFDALFLKKPKSAPPVVYPRFTLAVRPPTPTNGKATTLGQCERRVLTTLAQHGPCMIGKLALLSGYRVSGGFRNALSALRSQGLISGENTAVMGITPHGEAQGPFEPLPEGPAFRDYWLHHPSLGACERAVLLTLIQNPLGCALPELAQASGYQVSGGFRNALSTLRTAGLIVGKNTETMRPAQELL